MGKPGAKKMDQIVSVTPGDLHIIMIPSPGGPIPTPIPHPCASMIKDKVAKKVKVMGQPGAVKGSKSQHLPPHIPMGPGPFQKPPKNKGEIITGSSNVKYEGKAAAMLGDTGKMCADPSDMPVGKVIGTAALVMVGGGGSGGGAGGGKGGKGKKAKGAGGANVGEVTFEGHPVDVATGSLVVSGDDFELDGPLPLQFVRTYVSASAARDGPMGHGWSHNFQESFELIERSHPDWKETHERFEEGGDPSGNDAYVMYRDANGLPTAYHALEEGDQLVDEDAGRTIECRDGCYVLTTGFGIQHEFKLARRGSTLLVLTEIRDRNGNTTSLTYDDESRLERVVDCYGRSLFIAYKDRRITGLAFRARDDEGSEQVRSYEYDQAGDLVAVTDAAGTNRFEYTDHLVVRDVDREGFSFWFSYDESRRCVHTWGDSGYLTRRLAYDPLRQRTLVVNGEGENTLYEYDESGRVHTTTRGDGSTKEVTLDESGRVVGRSISGQDFVALEYTPEGDLAAVVDGEGGTTAFEYGADRRVTASTDRSGETSAYEYDDRGNMIRAIGPDGQATAYERDERGRVVRLVDGDGAVTTWTYDEYGHVESIERGGIRTGLAYDAHGQLLREVPADGPAVEYAWNEQGLPVRVTTGEYTLHEYTYDAEGYIRSWLNPEGVLHEYSYGAPDVVTGVVVHQTRAGHEPTLVSRVSLEVDTEGRPTRVENDRGLVEHYRYDLIGRVVEQASDGRSQRLEYNDLGQIASIEAHDGQVTNLEYDSCGRTTRVVHPDGVEDSFEYDEAGRLIAAANDEQELSFEYDCLGREIVRKQGAQELVGAYEPSGCTSTWLRGDGPPLTYATDPLRKSLTVSFAGHAVEITRDSRGRVVRRTFSNGIDESTSFDVLGRATDVRLQRHLDNQAVHARSVTYAGRHVSRVVDSIRGSRDYAYDGRGRLTSVLNGNAESYEFGGRDVLHSCHRFATSEYDERTDRLIRAGSRTYDYDAEGRVVAIDDESRGRTSFRYDVRGRMVAAHLADGGTVEYRYDVFGRRLEKRFEGGTRDGRRVTFLWKGDELIGEKRWQGDDPLVSRDYVSLEGAPLLRRDVDEQGEHIVFFHNDQLGAPQLCTDEAGAIVWRNTCDSFGFGPDDGVFQPLRLPGQYFDEETGLHYNRHRYYDPHCARYLQPDPLVTLLDRSLYSYPVDPLASADPLGLTVAVLNGDPTDSVNRNDQAPLSRWFGASRSNSMNLMGLSSNSLANVDTVVINAHGSATSIEVEPTTFKQRMLAKIGIKPSMSGKQLAAHLRASGFTGDKVVLASCSTGKKRALGGKNMAQETADSLGGNAEVVAWDRPIAVDRSTGRPGGFQGPTQPIQPESAGRFTFMAGGAVPIPE